MPYSHQFNRIASSLSKIYRPHKSSPPTSAIAATSFLKPHVTTPDTTSPAASRTVSSSSSPSTMDASNSTPKIHILGLGNLGKLFAHALTSSTSPSPVTILTHRPGLPYAFQQSGNAISILRAGTTTSTQVGSISISPLSLSDTTPIKHLIVTTKATDTAAALMAVIPRLNPQSTILFTQNGMGVVDEVNATCFPEMEKRPNYLTAIVVHGVFSTGPFSATHAAVVDMKIGHTLNGDPARSSDKSGDFPVEARELLRRIVDAQGLLAKEVDPRELICVQLEKMIANACINPLTVIFRTLNGGLLNTLVTPLRRVLCQEASEVFMAYLRSTMGLNDELKESFAPERLERVVKGITERTRENKSSMYQDFDAGRVTEIQYINGWFEKVGAEYGLDVSTHKKLVRLVEGKEEVKMEDIGNVFPKTKEYI